LHYCAHIPSVQKGHDKHLPKTGREWHVISIEEASGMKMICGDPKEVITEKELEEYNKICLSRIYPKGTRFDSSNYNPIPFWAKGCQIVALNYHRPSYPMWLNEGKFMRSGHCGYVLKPDWMQSRDPPIPKKKFITTLTIVVISGYRLPRPWGNDRISSTDQITKTKVIVSHWNHTNVINYYKKNKDNMPPDREPIDNSIPNYINEKQTDDDKQEARNPNFYVTDVDKQEAPNPNFYVTDVKEAHNPIWFRPDVKYKFDIQDKDIDMIVFEVKDSEENDKSFGKTVNRNRTIGYYAITVSDMRQGLRVVPLKGEDGAPLITGQLIVWVEFDENEVTPDEKVIYPSDEELEKSS